MRHQINIFQLVSALDMPASVLDFIKLDYQSALAGMKEFKRLVRKQRRILSTKYHPDRPGGDVKKMKAVNNVADYLLMLVIEPPRPQSVFSRVSATATSPATAPFTWTP